MFVLIVMLLVLLLVVVRVRSNKSSDEIPDVEMPLVSPMTMTPNPGPVFPLPTDETDPSSTEVLGVWVSIFWCMNAWAVERVCECMDKLCMDVHAVPLRTLTACWLYV